MTRLRANQLQAIGWVALTTFILLLPGRPDPSFPRWLPDFLDPFADKLVHAVLFGVLVVLLHRATATEGRTRRRLFWTVGSATVLIAVLEWAQRWMPYRSVDVWDALAGLAGALLAARVVSHKYR